MPGADDYAMLLRVAWQGLSLWQISETGPDIMYVQFHEFVLKSMI